MWKKKIRSVAGVWELLAGASFLKILAVLFLMAVTESLLFYRKMKVLLSGGESMGYYSFGEILTEAGAGYAFLSALAVLFLILLRTQGEQGSRSRYTLNRLRLTEIEIIGHRTVYNLLCFILLTAVQAGIFLWAAWIYGRLAGDYVTNQQVFLAFYRKPFLHNILPMAEAGKWVRNLFMMLSFSLEAAAGYRRKGYGTAMGLLIITGVWVYRSDTGMNVLDMFCDIMFICCILSTLWGIWMSGEEQEDE